LEALIFGANGQDGYYLSELLQQENLAVTGVSRNGDMVTGDVSDFNAVKELVTRHTPDYIFHLAANSTTRHSALFENHATISTGSLNVLECARLYAPQAKVFISGSGLQFKNNDQPIKETDPFEARDAYSVSRIQSVYAARYYRMLGLRTYVGYFFNHDSPRRSERHVSKMIANAVRSISIGHDMPIEIGDMSVRKEWTFAGDIVKAIWTLVKQDDIFEAVIGSGKAYSIQDYLEACFQYVQKDWKKYVTVKPGFQAEYKQLVSDPSTIMSLGWKPAVDFQQFVKMMLTT
jgi:GDPmannose 4,6-dehydratase